MVSHGNDLLERRADGCIRNGGFLIKRQADETDRLQILLNRTREEMAKEYVTKQEVHADINRIMNRLEVLDAKLDRLMEKHA